MTHLKFYLPICMRCGPITLFHCSEHQNLQCGSVCPGLKVKCVKVSLHLKIISDAEKLLVCLL